MSNHVTLLAAQMFRDRRCPVFDVECRMNLPGVGEVFVMLTAEAELRQKGKAFDLIF